MKWLAVGDVYEYSKHFRKFGELGRIFPCCCLFMLQNILLSGSCPGVLYSLEKVHKVGCTGLWAERRMGEGEDGSISAPPPPHLPSFGRCKGFRAKRNTSEKTLQNNAVCVISKTRVNKFSINAVLVMLVWLGAYSVPCASLVYWGARLL